MIILIIILKIRISINDDLSNKSNIELYNYLNYITNIIHNYTINKQKFLYILLCWKTKIS